MDVYAQYISLLILFGFPTTSQTFKILMYPHNSKSHIMSVSLIGDALTEKGHNVDMLVASNSDFEIHTNSQIRIIPYPVTLATPSERTDTIVKMQHDLAKVVDKGFVEYIYVAKDGYETCMQHVKLECAELLGNTDLFETLKQNQYDLVILDPFESVCSVAVPYKLNVPIVVTAIVPIVYWYYRVPVLPSVIPTIGTTTSNPMSLSERMMNLLARCFVELHAAYMALDTYYIDTYVPERDRKTPLSILQDALLWMNMQESLLYEPVPAMSNTLDIGDLFITESKALSVEYKDILNQPDKNVIYMAMGTAYDNLPSNVILKFCDAFRHLNKNITVLWSIKTTPQKCQLPESVMVKQWMPQNDILGHSNLNLFITHCGTKSFMESAYHGVPMICFPIGVDHIRNAVSLKHKGLGERLNLMTFTPQDLTHTIYSLLHNDSIKANVRRMSTLLHSKPVPAKDKVVYWIEHVIQHGGEHLRSSGHVLSLVEFLMVDMMCVYLCLLMTCTAAVAGLCRCVCRFLRRPSKRKYKHE